MNIRQLQYFIAVAKFGSMTEAAENLGVAQPTLTKTIRALELEVGAQLLTRMPRGVELTAFGRSLMRHAQAVSVQVTDAKREIDSLKGSTLGSVAIGAGPAWLRRILPEAVAQATAANPSLRVRIEGGYDDVLLEHLRSGDLDFVVAELPSAEASADLKTTELSSDRLAVCCRKGHALDGVKGLKLADLLHYDWAMPPESTRAHQRLRALFVAADLRPPSTVVHSESMTFLLQMIGYSDVLTLAVSTTREWPEGNNLVVLDVPDLDVQRRAGLITRRNGWLSPAARTIADTLMTLCRDTPAM